VFFLQTNGSGVLSFAGVSASAGQVIQVLGATDSTARSTSSTSFVTASNTLSVTITPSSASNKIFIICTFNSYTQDGTLSAYTIFRGATNLGATDGMSYFNVGDTYAGNSVSFLDSPNTTSATTYQMYLRKGGANSAYINGDNLKSSITCMEIKG
jgi:hypothetical protein